MFPDATFSFCKNIGLQATGLEFSQNESFLKPQKTSNVKKVFETPEKEKLSSLL